MKLFGFGKQKNNDAKQACGCDGAVREKKIFNTTENSCMCGENRCTIKVLGAGCKSCHKQYENVQKAVENIHLNAEIQYITDMKIVMSYGVMSMPAIVINEKVATMGEVLSINQVEELLKKSGC